MKDIENLNGKELNLPEDSYRGMDIVSVAKFINEKYGDQFVESPYEEVKDTFKNEGKKFLLEVIKEHLALYNVHIDMYSSEYELIQSGAIEKAFEKLKEHTFTEDGAFWLATEKAGDDKDRVLVKANGFNTYFASDIAYHNVKIGRGYDKLVNIWGVDHIGYIKRMEVAIDYLGLPSENVETLKVNLVKLMKDGEELKMSKRKGTSYTVEELVEEVGVDAARWFMLDRSLNSEFIFDVNVATSKSNDNPVFTVQYTHARANQLIEKSTVEAKAEKFDEKEVALINTLSRFPEVIQQVASSYKVNLLTQYILDVSKEFNSWYSNKKAIGHEDEASMIALTKAVKQVISNGLTLLGISSPERM